MVARLRREPPPLRRVSVVRAEALSSRLRRVTLSGAELDGLVVAQPAASVRLLIPEPGTDELVMPEWNGNVFLLPGGKRATIRTLTPRRLDAATGELDVDIVMHGRGPASEWARTAGPGDPCAVSGPARGYDVPEDLTALLVAGDETALPAISQLLEALPADAEIAVHVEVARPDARVGLPMHPRAAVTWHDLVAGRPPGDTLVEAVQSAQLSPDDRVWAAGEAAAMQRIRRHLLDERGMPRSRTWVRGYWKHGRAGDDVADGPE
jgi:NADPH-dependent ferric siderophore reductase